MLQTAFKPFLENPIFQTFDWFGILVIVAIGSTAWRSILSLRRARRERPIAGSLADLSARRDAAEAALDRHGSVSAYQTFQTLRLVALAAITGFVMTLMIVLGLIASLPGTLESNLLAGLIFCATLILLFIMMFSFLKTFDETFGVSRDMPRLGNLDAHITAHTVNPI